MRKLSGIGFIVFLSVATGAAGNPYPEKGPWGPLAPIPGPTNYLDYICDDTPGVLSIYIVYVQSWPPGVLGVEFSAPKPSCFTGLFLADASPFPVTVGNSQGGVSIGFGSCRLAPVHVLTINYYGFGTTPADCIYRTLPHPLTGQVSIVDCADNLLYIQSGGNYINPPEGNCEPIPVASLTWGGIKSLFSE